MTVTAPVVVIDDQYTHRNLEELVGMCAARGIELSRAEWTDPDAVRDALRRGVSEVVKRKSKRKHKAVKLTDQERRRQLIERQILEACAEGPVRPDDVAKAIIRNRVDVRALMMELTRRGRLESRDGYGTFGAVRA